jgi:hypothetical protein
VLPIEPGQQGEIGLVLLARRHSCAARQELCQRRAERRRPGGSGRQVDAGEQQADREGVQERVS